MSKKQSIIKVLGMAVSLPSSILGSYFFSDLLIHKELIKPWVGTAIVVVVTLVVLFLMVKYALKE